MSEFINKTLTDKLLGFYNKFSYQRLKANIMKNLLWILFAVIIGVFNAIAIAAALLVIDPAISQAAAIAWTIGGFVVGFYTAQRKA